MSLPFFYISSYSNQTSLTLDEDNSRHIVQVLRMTAGEELHLTDGKGNLLTAVITDAHKKHCQVTVLSATFSEAPRPCVRIAISLLKNSNRFEWFLEKATELGVQEIIPLVCARTEKEKFREERLHQILVSAMLQSQQVWKPLLSAPQHFSSYISIPRQQEARFIAHCVDGEKEELLYGSGLPENNRVILIGPEGDFTPEEIEAAMRMGFRPVALGNTRLRTETAGIVAATCLMR